MVGIGSLSLPTLAVLAVCTMSLAYIIIHIVAASLTALGRILSSTAGKLRKVLFHRPARRKTSPSVLLSDSAPITPRVEKQKNSVSLKSLIKSSAKSKAGTGGPDRHSDSELFIATLRGHSDSVTGLAFSSDGKTLASACEDRCLRVFDLRDPFQKNIPFRTFELRKGVRDIAFSASPFEVALLTHAPGGLPGLCTVDISGREVVFLNELTGIFTTRSAQGLCLRGSGGSGAAGCAPVMIASATSPEMRVFLAPRGGSLTPLAKIDTGGIQNYWAAVSNDGRFLAAATFASDLKIYEVGFDRAGSCTGVHKVMDLKGHRKKVTSVEFSLDGTRVVTASEDGTLRLWTLEVRYKMQEDPKCLVTVGLPSGRLPISRLAWGRGGHIAAAAGSDLYILNGRTGEVVDTVLSAHSGDITDVIWSPTKSEGPQGAVTVLATAGVDGRVRLWRGPWPLA